MSLILNNVSYVYSPNSPFETKALSEVDLLIEHGEMVGIIGHTGSGKSTLVQHFNALLLPTSGNICVDGIDVTESAEARKIIRGKVGLVFQYPEYQLFAETVQEDVAFGPKNLGLSGEEILERVTEALNFVGLDVDKIGHKSPFELSGGQKRRVAIAGVIAMRPEILVLDEPTAGLDPGSRNEILKEIEIMQKTVKNTVILITHSMEQIAEFVDRVVVLNAGKIILDGQTRDVFAEVDRLRATGLDVPAMAEVIASLKDRDIKISKNVLTVEEAFSAIMEWKRGVDDV